MFGDDGRFFDYWTNESFYPPEQFLGGVRPYTRYDGRSFADPGQTLGGSGKERSGKALSVAKNMKVSNLEDNLKKSSD